MGNEEHTTLSARQTLDRCGFCSLKGQLEPCVSCGTVAYCSQEHQRFDWKRHKMLCKVVVSRMSQAVTITTDTEESISSMPMSTSFSEGLPTAFRPYARRSEQKLIGVAGTSNGAEFVRPRSVESPSVRRKTSSVPPQTVPAPPLSAGTPPLSTGTPPLFTGDGTERKPSPPVRQPGAAASNGVSPSHPAQETERIVETEDPEIQIIESSSTRPRKRPTSSVNSSTVLVDGVLRQFKDHSQNMSYNVTPEEHNRYLMEQGRAFNRHQSGELRLSFIAEHILKSLNDFGWAVIDNFLGKDHCSHVNKEMQVLESRGLFTAGQLVEGKNKDEQHVKDIRSDKTYWFAGSDARSSDACTVRMLVTYLDGIVNRFARRLPGNSIQGRSKAMLAIYPGNGSRYVKHVDNPAKDGRRITVIYYCNPGWDHVKDGGVLRLYPESSPVPLDIEPKADRLLIFWSDHRIPHEVMPVFKDRYAITVWYMDRNERDEHIKKSDARAAPQATPPPTATAVATEKEELGDLLPKSPKEQKLDSASPPTLRNINIRGDVGEAESADSGRGASLGDRFGSTQSLSFQSHRTHDSKDSGSVSDEDPEEIIAGPPETDPEYQI